MGTNALELATASFSLAVAVTPLVFPEGFTMGFANIFATTSLVATNS